MQEVKMQEVKVKAPIHARFDLVWKLSDMAGVMLHRQDLWQIPLVGEIVNIGGYPYRVISRGWGLPEVENPSTPIDQGGRNSGYTQYAVVKVQKATNFTVELGGREY
jgi:hypothetical protein